MKTETKKKKGTAKKVLCVFLAIILAFVIGDVISINWHSNPENVKKYETTNPHIVAGDRPQISAHRSGGGIEPEESMLAFKNCAENPNLKIDVFEFDLHITKDDVLILLHDDTLDRTTDCAEVFGEEEVRPENKTYEELRQLNIGAKFETDDGKTPYADLKGENVPDDLKILRVEDILDYLISKGDYEFIIEIKNSGDLGKKGVDILYQILKERNIVDKVIFGSFHEEVSLYVDEKYPDFKRSATIKEVLAFFGAALRNDKNFNPSYVALQIPYNMPWRIAFNLGTAKMINYAHEHNLAVQYWTINKESELEYLSSMGVDCIMSDYPNLLYDILNK